MTALSPVTRRLLAVAILLLLILGLWTLVVEPLTARHAHYDEQISQARELLIRYRNIIETEERLTRELASLRESQSDSGGLLSAENPDLGAAEIQTQIKQLVTDSGGSLKSIGNLPAEDRGIFERVAIRVNILSDTNALQRILYEIEGSSPYLFVDNIDVRSRSARRRKRDRAAAETDALQVRFDVSGYIRAEQP